MTAYAVGPIGIVVSSAYPSSSPSGGFMPLLAGTYHGDRDLLSVRSQALAIMHDAAHSS